jgi:hypothetical protein
MSFGWDDVTVILALVSQLGCAGVMLGMIETIHVLTKILT